MVNQRLFGEIVLEKFEVSHTKDQILFDDGEKEELELKLKEELADLRQLALSYRKGNDERIKGISDAQRAATVNRLEQEIDSDPIQDFLKQYEFPSESLIHKSNEAVKNAVVERSKPDLKSKVGDIHVSLYMAKDMSPNDPYVIIESTKSRGFVIVIINLNHPHWVELTNSQSVTNFVRHCTYDGVAEAKAYLVRGKIEPDTVKLIKDNLLRLPFQMQK